MKERFLIQTNQYFTKSSWEKCFKEYCNEFNVNIEIQFVSTNEELIKLLSSSTHVFSFQLPDIDLIRHLDLIYLGISDIDYLDNYILPPNFNLYTSKGLASSLIAEHTLLVTLSLIRKFTIAVINQPRKKWDQKSYFEQGVKSIKDFKIGVLGLGNNGRAIVEIFKKMGCWVAGYSNDEKDSEDLDLWYSPDNLNGFLTKCDIIIVSVPLRTETYHLLSKKQFELMGNNAFLINIARGEIIDENELFLALKERVINGAAIDVFEKEPLSRKSKLWKLPNIIITPHIAGNIHFLIKQIELDFISKIRKNA